jgi:hypothetical protein
VDPATNKRRREAAACTRRSSCARRESEVPHRPYDGGSLARWSIAFGYQHVVKPNDFDGNEFSDFLWQNSDGTPASGR